MAPPEAQRLSEIGLTIDPYVRIASGKCCCSSNVPLAKVVSPNSPDDTDPNGTVATCLLNVIHVCACVFGQTECTQKRNDKSETRRQKRGGRESEGNSKSKTNCTVLYCGTFFFFFWRKRSVTFSLKRPKRNPL